MKMKLHAQDRRQAGQDLRQGAQVFDLLHDEHVSPHRSVYSPPNCYNNLRNHERGLLKGAYGDLRGSLVDAIRQGGSEDQHRQPPASNYLRPELIKDLVQHLNGTIVECNTAYNGSREEAGKTIDSWLKGLGF